MPQERKIEAVLKQLFQRRRGEIKPGLGRVQRAYERLAQPARNVPHALIAGTNGKGTTAGFLWILLQQRFSQVGLYTSPHLRHFSERIQLSHQEVDDAYLVARLEAIKHALPQDEFSSLSFFELTTLLAFSVFAGAKADAYVLEVGLGGRWDATNISKPSAVAIVSIDMDHQEYLGDSLEQIAGEKAAIMRAGVPAFLGRGVAMHEDQSVLQVFASQAKKVGCPLYRYGSEFFLEKLQGSWQLETPQEVLPLPHSLTAWPSYKRENLAISLMMARHLGATRKELAQGLSHLAQSTTPLSPSLEARTQRISVKVANDTTQEIFLDVAHNPAGVRCLKRSLGELGLKFPVPGLVTFLGEKDCNQMLDIFTGFLQPLVLFKNKSERSFSSKNLASRHAHLKVHEDFRAAWEVLTASCACGGDQPWLIAGSVMGLGDAIDYLFQGQKDA